jgi:hypothetical protein
MRQQYFNELMKDCQDVCKHNNIDPEDQAIVTAALILSDSLNGLRKALLSPAWLAPRNPGQH